MWKSLGLSAVLALGACTSPPESQYAGPLTPDEKRAALAYIKTAFFDPYSIRDASIAVGTRAAPASPNALWPCGLGSTRIAR